MAKPPTRRLKVFQAQLGFWDTVVAAPSQAAALRAWGVSQNLFASGDAKVTTDDAAVAVATAHPEIPLRRALGSREPFALEPTRLPTVPDAPKRSAAKAAPKLKPTAPSRPRADRSTLDAAEKALADLEDRRKREKAGFRAEAEDLDRRRVAAQAAYVEARKAAAAQAAKARTDYRKAGGSD